MSWTHKDRWATSLAILLGIGMYRVNVWTNDWEPPEVVVDIIGHFDVHTHEEVEAALVFIGKRLVNGQAGRIRLYNWRLGGSRKREIDWGHPDDLWTFYCTDL